MLKNNIQNNLENAQRDPRRTWTSRKAGRAAWPARSSQRRERLAEIEDQLTRMREELRGKSEQAQEAAQLCRAPWPGSWRSCGRRQAMETATAAEAKALLSALAAAAQEVLDRDETVRRELPGAGAAGWRRDGRAASGPRRPL